MMNNKSPANPKNKQNILQSISLNSLQEGEIFDLEINRIMSIVSNVEREFGQKKVNKEF